MIQETHNPHCRLISVTINNKEFVYGEENITGSNPGLEVYHPKYSRRYKPNTVPVIYQILFRKLKKMTAACRPGHKLTLSIDEFKQLS